MGTGFREPYDLSQAEDNAVVAIESKRVQQLCFGGTHISDSNAPGRGFFSNSTRGPLGSANATDPALLAVIGIVITLGATVLQLIRGN